MHGSLAANANLQRKLSEAGQLALPLQHCCAVFCCAGRGSQVNNSHGSMDHHRMQCSWPLPWAPCTQTTHMPTSSSPLRPRTSCTYMQRSGDLDLSSPPSRCRRPASSAACAAGVGEDLVHHRRHLVGRRHLAPVLHLHARTPHTISQPASV